ncbi:MAG TPA: class I SAM-dependent methyltransferase [bacterium]|nr:class I SAM-dependent methyltransferase [bacterium]
MTPKRGYTDNVDQYKKRVFSKIKGYLTGSTLLDAGCGDGSDALIMLPYFKKICGFDIEKNSAWKKAPKKISFKTAAAEKIPYKSLSFDTVYEKDMLHHCSDPFKAIKEMARVAKKKVIIIEANRYNPLFYINLTLLNNHQHFTKKKFRAVVESAGLPFTISRFSARVCPINNRFIIDCFDSVENFLDRFPPYSPIIEYNLAVLEKK